MSRKWWPHPQRAPDLANKDTSHEDKWFQGNEWNYRDGALFGCGSEKGVVSRVGMNMNSAARIPGCTTYQLSALKQRT